MESSQEQLLIYSALLTATTSLARGSTPDDVLREACDALVSSSSHICLAWMYLGNPDIEPITPSYSVGRAAEYTENLVLDLSPEALSGPGRRSLAMNLPVLVKTRTDPSFNIWRERAFQYDLQEGLTLPIGNPDEAYRGLIVIFADAPEYFDQVGVEPFIAFSQLAGVALDQANLKMKLEEMATIDPTTNLLNRRAFMEILNREYAKSRRTGDPFSLLLMDLDRFKLLNDNYGHALGDKMLRGISEVSQNALRSCDWIGRWGGRGVPGNFARR